jgi:hypothetical protein
LIISDVPAVELSNLVPPATGVNSDNNHNMGLDNGSGDKQEDELEGKDEGYRDRDSNCNPLSIFCIYLLAKLQIKNL